MTTALKTSDIAATAPAITTNANNGTTLNGKATNGKPANSLTATPPKADTLPAAKITTSPEAEEATTQIPLEDRILKVQILGDLIAKREKLLDSLKKINTYKFSTENRFDKLEISDSEGNEFTTTNSEVLTDVIACIKATINRKLAEVNSQIIF